MYSLVFGKIRGKTNYSENFDFAQIKRRKRICLAKRNKFRLNTEKKFYSESEDFPPPHTLSLSQFRTRPILATLCTTAKFPLIPG